MGRHHGGRPRAQRGFTLVELMIVVAIIAVLAIVVVPTFMGESTRTKAKSEVSPMFAELATRQDQYKLEQGSYLSTSACPATANSKPQDITSSCLAAGSEWNTLRIQPHETKLSCSYTITAGVPGDDPLGVAPGWVTGLMTPATSWYFIVATCPATEYFQASWDTRLRSKDGK
jgi:prepilin-type N-terminal cleavage/methylation domain-containing protein